MSLQSLVESYGYLAIFVGTFLEGETILILGGLAAHLGYLELPMVVAAACAGSLLGDQLYFLIGRYRGRAYLAKRPAWQSRSRRVEALLNRHQSLIILGFRFLYGLRTVTPFVIGVAGVPLRRFVVLNALGALIWASSFGILGFVFGQGLEVLIGEIKHYELEVMVGIALLGLGLWGIQRLRRSRGQGR